MLALLFLNLRLKLNLALIQWGSFLTVANEKGELMDFA